MDNVDILNRNENLKENDFFQYDELTGLYNQMGFFSATRKLLDKNSNEKYVFVRLDVDHFRMINSFYGSNEGNALLKFIAFLIKTAISGQHNCVCGRIYADVFALCLPIELGNELFLTKNIINKISEYQKSYYITFSVGFYEIENNAMEIINMFDNASMASKLCKDSIYQNFAYYNAEMAEEVNREHTITRCMKDALEHHEFQVYYQPKYDILNERAYGAEALVRWEKKTGEIINPDDFIPVFEKNGFILEMDFYVWEEVCKFIRAQINEGVNILPISVNVSRLNMYDPSFIQKMKNLIAKYNVPIDLFQIEITESIFTESQSIVMNTILDLHREGFTIMMDDFGSGYSSLNILKDMSLDVLKIDMKFLSNTNTKRGETILEAIVKMAVNLKLQVIVEGIEREKQLNLIKSMGVNYFQGYYYAKPMPQSEYTAFIASQNDSKKFIKPQGEVLNIYDDFYQNFFTSTLIGLPYGVLLFNKYGEIFQFNQALTSMFECGNSMLQVKQFLETNHFLELLSENIHGLRDNKLSFVAEVNGKTKYYVVSSIKIADLNGNHWGKVCYFIDESIGALFGTENYYKKMFDSFVQLYHHVFEFDYIRDEIREIYCDTEHGHHRFEETADYVSMTQCIPKLLEYIHPNDRSQFLEFISEDSVEDAFLIQKKRSIECDLRIKKEENVYAWSNFSLHLIQLASHVITYMCCLRDITDVKEAEKDYLSGLLTRGAFIKAIEALMLNRNSIKNHAFIMIDVDYYKHINDTYGHQVGDEVVQIIGDCLKKIFEISSICGRIGGDEFVLFSRNPVEKEYLRSNLYKLQLNLIEATYGKTLNEELTLSIGCYYVEKDTMTFDEMYELADSLMYQAKKERNTIIEG